MSNLSVTTTLFRRNKKGYAIVNTGFEQLLSDDEEEEIPLGEGEGEKELDFNEIATGEAFDEAQLLNLTPKKRKDIKRFAAQTFRVFTRFVMIMHFVATLICAALVILFIIKTASLQSSYLEISLSLTSRVTIYNLVVNVLSAPFSLSWLLFGSLVISLFYFIYHSLAFIKVNRALEKATSSLTLNDSDVDVTLGHLQLSTPSIFLIGLIAGFTSVYLAFVSGLFNIDHVVPMLNLSALASLIYCVLFSNKRKLEEYDNVFVVLFDVVADAVIFAMSVVTFLAVPILGFTTQSSSLPRAMAEHPEIFDSWRLIPVVILVVDAFIVLLAFFYYLKGPHFLVFHVVSTFVILIFNIMLTVIVISSVEGTLAYDTLYQLTHFLYA